MYPVYRDPKVHQIAPIAEALITVLIHPIAMDCIVRLITGVRWGCRWKEEEEEGGAEGEEE